MTPRPRRSPRASPGKWVWSGPRDDPKRRSKLDRHTDRGNPSNDLLIGPGRDAPWRIRGTLTRGSGPCSLLRCVASVACWYRHAPPPLILIAVVTWLVSYISPRWMIVLRHKYPDRLLSFKTPFLPDTTDLGIAACVYMIFSVHPDPAEELSGCLPTPAHWPSHAVVWLRFVKKLPCSEPVLLDEEMKMIRERSQPVNPESTDAGKVETQLSRGNKVLGGREREGDREATSV